MEDVEAGALEACLARRATLRRTVVGRARVAHMLELVDRLDDREQAILKLRFGLSGERPRTLEEVSQTIGRTRERVRQIQNQALEKLRMMLEDEGMQSAVA